VRGRSCAGPALVCMGLQRSAMVEPSRPIPKQHDNMSQKNTTTRRKPSVERLITPESRVLMKRKKPNHGTLAYFIIRYRYRLLGIDIREILDMYISPKMFKLTKVATRIFLIL
jgi:hypothetical protein